MDSIRLLSMQEFTSFAESLKQENLSRNDPGLLQALTDWMEEGNCKVGVCLYGLFQSARIAGVIGVSEEDDLEPVLGVYTLIGVIFVHPDFRGQGIGTTLVEYVKKHGRTEWIAASPADHESSQFFRACRFFRLQRPELQHENLLFFQLENLATLLPVQKESASMRSPMG